MKPGMYFDRFMHPHTPTMGTICSAPPPDDGKGAGGGGAGAAGGAGGAGGSGDGEFTDAQIAKIGEIANSASSTHATRIEKRFDTKLGEATASITTTMTEGFATLQAKNADDADKDKDKDKSSKGESAALTKMRAEHDARMKEMETKFKDSEQLRIDEANSAKVSDERAVLAKALRDHKVPEGLIKGAIAQLYVEDKRIKRNDEGTVIYVAQRDGYVDNLTPAKGVEEWLKSKEGQHYAPAPNVAGSGAQGQQRRGQEVDPNASKAEKKRAAKRELMRHIIGGQQ